MTFTPTLKLHFLVSLFAMVRKSCLLKKDSMFTKDIAIAPQFPLDLFDCIPICLLMEFLFLRFKLVFKFPKYSFIKLN